MKVTEGMLTENGQKQSKYADYIGVDDVGILVEHERGWVTITIDSNAWPNKKIRLNPSDAEGVAFLLAQRAIQAREYRDAYPSSDHDLG